ncbi:MAG: hypothetical protein COC05_05520 [Gammaproteobacteria bacterium]|nr:MAG: hypothetical protein COC05_05520 [Gammaproteobacteria bacterium]
MYRCVNLNRGAPLHAITRHLELYRNENPIISFIVSDHSPCTPQLKEIDSGDLEKAWGGISALQFGLPLIWTEAKKQGFDLVDISRLMSLETAKFAGLEKRKGQIAVGYDADLLIFDEKKHFEISNDMIKHRHKITPYVGREVLGVVKRTYVRGHLVFDDAYANNKQFINNPIGKPILKHELKT